MSTVNDLSGSATVNASPVSHKGCFVMWQMLPEKWLIELVGGGHKISAGRENRIEVGVILLLNAISSSKYRGENSNLFKEKIE